MQFGFHGAFRESTVKEEVPKVTRERWGVFGQPADGAWKWKIVLPCEFLSLEGSGFGSSKGVQADEEN